MAKRNRKAGKTADVVEKVDSGKQDPVANQNLADFAKGAAKKEAEKAAAKAAKAPKGPSKGKDGMPKLPNLPRGAAKQKALKPCACGCPLQTRSKFAPGHDSRLKGWAMRIARGMFKLEAMTEVYETTQGEQDAVAAYIKQLKKEGKFDALKTAQAPVPKKATVVEETDADEQDEDDSEESEG